MEPHTVQETGWSREAVHFITSMLESSTDYSILGKDLEGNILLWNEGARRLHRYEPEEVVGRADFSMLHILKDVKAANRGKSCMPRCAMEGGRGQSTGGGRMGSLGQVRASPDLLHKVGREDGEVFSVLALCLRCLRSVMMCASMSPA